MVSMLQWNYRELEIFERAVEGRRGRLGRVSGYLLAQFACNVILTEKALLLQA